MVEDLCSDADKVFQDTLRKIKMCLEPSVNAQVFEEIKEIEEEYLDFEEEAMDESPSKSRTQGFISNSSKFEQEMINSLASDLKAVLEKHKIQNSETVLPKLLESIIRPGSESCSFSSYTFKSNSSTQTINWDTQAQPKLNPKLDEIKSLLDELEQ